MDYRDVKEHARRPGPLTIVGRAWWRGQQRVDTGRLVRQRLQRQPVPAAGGRPARRLAAGDHGPDRRADQLPLRLPALARNRGFLGSGAPETTPPRSPQFCGQDAGGPGAKQRLLQDIEGKGVATVTPLPF